MNGLTLFLLLFLQIDRASAGNVKLTDIEKADCNEDDLVEDEFGYSTSNY